MTPMHDYLANLTRRHFFKKSGVSLGAAALATLAAHPSARAVSRSLTPTPLGSVATGGLPDVPHFPPRAKRAIYLHMNGGPSQMDMLDYKPVMNDWYDKDLPESIRNGQRLTTMTSGQARFPIAPSKYNFEPVGKNGLYVSELLPFTKKIIDDITVIRTVHTEAINHDPAVTFICTGSQLPGRPSLGAWLSYGLGSENSDLPAFIVMTATWSSKRDAQAIYNRLWGTGFLPSRHQGTALRAQGDPVLFLSNPDGVDGSLRRRMLDTLGRLNQKEAEEVGDPETQARIAQYEMAFKMQTSVPELTDISKEPKHILDMYGPDVHTPGTFARSCLLARRMAERGVRFTQIFHRGWDQHGNVARDLPLQCQDVDQPCYALITDLKQRGLLEDTLVVWGGEFGRTIYSQGKLSHDDYGRDHHPRCFTVWMAGAGVKAGYVHGQTDEFCYNIVKDPVHVHDMNATILQQLGIDHERLTYRFQGRDFRLTDVHGSVIKDILA
jgi:hypothetical protein